MYRSQLSKTIIEALGVLSKETFTPTTDLAKKLKLNQSKTTPAALKFERLGDKLTTEEIENIEKAGEEMRKGYKNFSAY